MLPCKKTERERYVNVKSLKGKLVLLLLAIVFSILMVLYVANNMLLEPYYTEKEKVEFKETYQQIQVTAAEHPEELADLFFRIAANSNMSVIVVDHYNQMIYSSVNPSDGEETVFSPWMLQHLMESTPIPSNQQFVIRKMLDSNGSEHLVMAAKFQPFGKIFLIKPVAAIHKSMEIYREFFLIAFIIVGLMGAVIMFLIGNFSVRPIYEILDISKRITNMDFSKKYQVRGDDEINVLGEQINIMSERLSENIQKLSASNESLQQDLYQKERIEKMRKEFLQNAAHELKTPISVIASYTEMLKDKLITDEQDREYYYSVIYDETEKMSNIVKNLLNVAQLETQAFNVSMEEFNLSELLADVIATFRLQIEKEAIVLQENIMPEVTVLADRFLIERVITNYLNNAIVHMGEPKEIRVNLSQTADGAYLGVYNSTPKVLDQEKIWTSFYKSDDSQGNGLGLSIVKAIMDAHKKEYGFCYLEEGVEFFIKL